MWVGKKPSIRSAFAARLSGSVARADGRWMSQPITDPSANSTRAVTGRPPGSSLYQGWTPIPVSNATTRVAASVGSGTGVGATMETGERPPDPANAYDATEAPAGPMPNGAPLAEAGPMPNGAPAMRGPMPNG